MWLLFLFLIPAITYGSPAEEPTEKTIPILETTQELLGGRINTVANRLDLFFADQRADDELARSRIRIRQFFEVRERSLMRNDTQFRFNIRLPSLEEKFKFEIKKSDEEKDKEKKLKVEAQKDVTQNELNKRWQFRSDVSVNAGILPTVAVRGRLRKNWQTGVVIHRFVEELGWFSDRDWEEGTSVDSDLPLSEDTLLRLGHSSEWKITRKGYRTSHGPSLRHRLSNNDAVSFGTGLSTVIEDSWHVNNYRISVTYRRNMYKQWLYMDIIPGLDFPKIWSFRRTPFIGLRLEALFGGY